MSAEFTTIGPRAARSLQGFTVVFDPSGTVHYSDASDSKVRVDAELHVKPERWVLYANSKDLRNITGSRADEILANIRRAMEYFGEPTVIDRN
jgi:hypothetical protein